MKMNFTKVTFLFMVVSLNSVSSTCPHYCSCDMWKNMRRATCVNKKLYTIEIGVPQAVQVLDVSLNSIATIEDNSFQNLGLIHLRILNLDRNHIKHIGMHAFRGLKELHVLDLSNNHIKYLVHGTFQHTPRLTNLYLRGNEFSGEGTGLVLEIPTLQVLDLSQCHIGYLATNIFFSLKNLTTLILSENELVKLDTATLEPLKKLQKVNISKNPWHCDSNTKKLIEWLNIRNVKYVHICKEEEKIKKFEKMIVLPEDDDEENFWTYEEQETHPKIENITIKSCPENKRLESPYIYTIFDNIPSFWAFLMGLEIGVMSAVIGMWLWLKVCDSRDKSITYNMSQTQRSLRIRSDRSSLHHWTELETINCPDTPPPPYRDINSS